MSDRTVGIEFKTKADTSGAKEAADSIEGVKDSARDAAQAVGTLDDEKSLQNLPADAAKASLSIDQLEENVRKLEAELRKLPVGSKEFTAMGERVKAARKEFGLAEADLRKLGGTMGYKGNAGMAVLEFSRAFEDAQYGIRGVLNNIPGLITMLGGGAGLAGVISLVAVIGAQLWEKMSQGPKDAKKATNDYLDNFMKAVKVFDDLQDAGYGEIEDRVKAAAKNLQATLSGIDNVARVDDDKAKVEAVRIESEKRVALSEKALELAKLESLARNSGEVDALGLAERRKQIAEDILQIERETVEAKRQLAVKSAEADVGTASQKVDATKQSAESIGNDYKALMGAIEALRAEAEALSKDRYDTQAMLAEEREKTLKDIENLRDPASPNYTGSGDVASDSGVMSRLEALLENQNKRIQELATPAYEETAKYADAWARENGKELSDLRSRMDESAKAQDAAAKAMTTATLALFNLRQTQASERAADQSIQNNQKQIESINKPLNDPALKKIEQDAAESTRRLMQEILERIPEGAKTADLKSITDKIQTLIGDGEQKGEASQIEELLGQLATKMERSNDGNRAIFQRISDNTDLFLTSITELTQKVEVQNIQAKEAALRIKNLESNAKR